MFLIFVVEYKKIRNYWDINLFCFFFRVCCIIIIVNDFKYLFRDDFVFGILCEKWSFGVGGEILNSYLIFKIK